LQELLCGRKVASEVRILPLSANASDQEGTPHINSEVQTVNTNIDINGTRIIIEGKVLRIARPEQEWFEDVEDPEMLINALRRTKRGPDILTFWQRFPDVEPKYSYPMETDSIAALPIKSYR
jgi:hypothetical protein